MRVTLASAFIVVFLISPVTGSAAEPTARANPYVNLFNARLAVGQAPALPMRPTFPVTPLSMSEPIARAGVFSPIRPPAVVCGMTMIPGDPKIDPRIFVPGPKRDVTPMMRIVSPAVCRR